MYNLYLAEKRFKEGEIKSGGRKFPVKLMPPRKLRLRFFPAKLKIFLKF